MPREDGRDRPALFPAGREERQRRDAVPEAKHGAGGFEGGQPVAVGVQSAEVGDLFLQTRAGRDIARRRGPVQANEKSWGEVGHAGDESVASQE